jgi:hypothetical protein
MRFSAMLESQPGAGTQIAVRGPIQSEAQQSSQRCKERKEETNDRKQIVP